MRVVRIDGQFKALPTYEEIAAADLDITFAGTEQSVVMVEAGATGVPEAVVLEAIAYAMNVIQQLNGLQKEIVAAGEEVSLREQSGWAHKGPPAARVERVDTRWSSFTGDVPDCRLID